MDLEIFNPRHKWSLASPLASRCMRCSSQGTPERPRLARHLAFLLALTKKGSEVERSLASAQFNRNRGGLKCCASHRKQRTEIAINRNKLSMRSACEIRRVSAASTQWIMSCQASPATNHQFPYTNHHRSNRHTRGLEFTVTLFPSTKDAFLIATNPGVEFQRTTQNHAAHWSCRKRNQEHSQHCADWNVKQTRIAIRGAAGVVHCGEKQRGIGQARTRQFKNTIQGGRP